MLAPSGVRHAPHFAKGTDEHELVTVKNHKQTRLRGSTKSQRPSTKGGSKMFEPKANIALKGVPWLHRGLGGYPRGGRSCAPHGNSTIVNPFSTTNAQARARGLLSRVSIGGTLADIPDKRSKADQWDSLDIPHHRHGLIDVLTWPTARIAIDLGLEHGNTVE